MNLTGCEDVWVEAILKDKQSLVVGTVYRHPQQNLKSFSLAFQNTLKKLKRFTKFVVLGDFNIDYGCYNTSSAVKSYADNITSLGCEQFITWPTRISSTNRQSILDHVYVDSYVMINDVITAAVIESDISRSRGFIFPEAFRLTLVKGIVRIKNVELRPLIKAREKKEKSFLIGRKVSTNQKQKR